MEKKQTLVSVSVLVLAVAIAAAFVTKLTGGSRLPGVSSHAYYYDLNTGELFIDDAALIPPIDAPSGVLKGTEQDKAGVRAYVFTCGEDNETDRYIAWIETYTPEAQSLLIESKPDKSTHPLGGPAGGGPVPLVAQVNPDAPDKLTWTSSMSLMGVKLIQSSTAPCPNGSAPTPCIPK